MQDIQDKIKLIVKDLIDLNGDIDENYKIGPDSGWDSLTIVRLIVILEEQLDIKLKIDFFSEQKSIMDICRYKDEK